MDIRQTAIQLAKIVRSVRLMTDNQIDWYIINTQIDLIEIPEIPIHSKVLVGTKVKTVVECLEPRHWILINKSRHIKFLSKRSFVEWHIAKYTGVFDDICNEENDAT